MPQLRQLIAERKIYYIDNGPRQQIPLRAIEAFANGLPAKSVLEENIAHVRAGGNWDEEMEKIAGKLLAEWTIS